MFDGIIAFGYNEEEGCSPDWNRVRFFHAVAPGCSSPEDVLEVMDAAANDYCDEFGLDYGLNWLDVLDEIPSDVFERAGVNVYDFNSAYLFQADQAIVMPRD